MQKHNKLIVTNFTFSFGLINLDMVKGVSGEGVMQNNIIG